jgi:hypothetical protein
LLSPCRQDDHFLDSDAKTIPLTTARDVSKATRRAAISGFVKPGFEAVREAFVENFERGAELGAACCVYHRGEKVVDLWGGVKNEASDESWQQLCLGTTDSKSSIPRRVLRGRFFQ